ATKAIRSYRLGLVIGQRTHGDAGLRRARLYTLAGLVEMSKEPLWGSKVNRGCRGVIFPAASGLGPNPHPGDFGPIRGPAGKTAMPAGRCQPNGQTKWQRVGIAVTAREQV